MTDVINEIQECRVYDQQTWYSLIEYILFLKHQRPYFHVRDRAAGKHILDFGCGSGYGAAILAEKAESVVGVDASPRAIEYCQARYAAPNLSFTKIQADYTLPFEDNRFDFITSCQVIEHIPDVRRYLVELKRVLKPGGSLILTTPNRAYRLLPFQMIWQPAHVREYSLKAFRKDLAPVFPRSEILGVYGSTESYNRVYIDHYRQTPLKAYVIQPLKQLARTVLADETYRRLRDTLGLGTTPPTHPVPESILEHFHIDHVLVGPDLSAALDFLAVCTKG